MTSCEIKNALVLLCCIEDYNEQRTGYNPLPGAIKDETKLTKLFAETLGFKVMSPEIASYDPAQHGKRVKIEEFDTFLNVNVRTEWKDNGQEYDAIIFVAACHGQVHSNDGACDRIRFSDCTGGFKSIADIKATLNGIAPGITKLFLWDICRTYSANGGGDDKAHAEKVRSYLNTVELFPTIKGDYTEESTDDGGDLIGAFCELMDGNNIIEGDLEDLGKKIKNKIYWRAKKRNCPVLRSTAFPTRAMILRK